jgi:hypothetical protein
MEKQITIMMRLMDKIMLSCKQATFFSSVKNYKKLKVMQKIQLRMHLSMCQGCKEFDRQSQIIDDSMAEIQKEGYLQSEETLAKEKKSQIKSTINQHLN